MNRFYLMALMFLLIGIIGRVMGGSEMAFWGCMLIANIYNAVGLHAAVTK